jgi:hypothetical protein
MAGKLKMNERKFKKWRENGKNGGKIEKMDGNSKKWRENRVS